MKPELLPFALAAAMGLIAWGAVIRRYAWPRLRTMDLRSAAEPILYLHLFRFVGLAFLTPGAVGAGLDPRWAVPAAYGDVGASLLAAFALLASRGPLFRPALWLFGLWGTFDLLRAAVLGPAYDVAGRLQSTVFIPTVGVPLLLWTHVVIFALLLRPAAHDRAGNHGDPVRRASA